MELKGTVSIVTGGTGGLGRRICRALARRGSRVIVCYDRREDEARLVVRDLRDSLEAEGEAVRLDLRSLEAATEFVGGIVKGYGSVDVLINNAAYNKWIPYDQLEALSPDDWNTILAINLTGPFLCMKAVAPIMKRQGGGRIVNIASVAGLTPTGSSIPYAVSKAGLIHLTRCMAVALAPEILVNCVAPGYMEGTRMTENLSGEYRKKVRESSLLRREVDKDDVANAVAELVQTESITGQTLVVDAGRVFH